MKQAAYFAITVASAALVAFLVSNASVASSEPHPVKQLTTAAIASSTLASSRSLTITNNEVGNQSYGLALLYTTITDANNSETGVTLTCYGNRTSGSTSYRIPACPFDDVNLRYNCEAGPLFWNPSDETSPKSQVFRVDIEGFVNITCTYSFTGGSASDSIVVAVDVATKS